MEPVRSIAQRPSISVATADRIRSTPGQPCADAPLPGSIRGKTGPPVQGAAAAQASRANARTSTLDLLAGLVGDATAAILVATRGGTRVYIPQEPQMTDSLSQLIGYEAACALAEIYGGDRIEIPNPPPRRVRILELRASGVSIDVIARTLHCTRRRVFQVMAEARALSSASAATGVKTRTIPHPPARSPR
jgi:hypothetical protein